MNAMIDFISQLAQAAPQEPGEAKELVDYVRTYAWPVAGMFVFVLALVNVVMIVQVVRMGSEKHRVVSTAPNDHRQQYNSAAVYHEWAQRNGFDWLGSYKHQAMPRMFLAAWRHREQPIIFCTYIHPQVGILHDLVTMYEHDIALTTGSSKDAHMLPMAPGKFIQAFHKQGIEKLWERHHEAMRYMESHGCKPASAERLAAEPFEELLAHALRQQMKHVRSLPFWWLRGVYWFFVRRGRLVDKTLEQLHNNGVFDL